MIRPRQIKLAVTKYGFLHIYKLTTSLVSLKKISLYNKIPLFILSTNCLGKQFIQTFLGTSSNNGSLKNVLCSKRISIILALKVLVLLNTFPLFDTESSNHSSTCGSSVWYSVTSFIRSLAATAAFCLREKSRAFGSKTTSFGAL